MTRSSVPCTTTTGQRTAAHWSSTERSPGTRPTSARTRVSPSVPQAPPHEVLDQLRRVLLRHQLVEEEVEEAGVVAQPGVPVVATPARRRRRCPRPTGRTTPGGPAGTAPGPGWPAPARPRRRPVRGGRRRGRGPAGCPSRAPTTTARRVPVASSTSSASCVSCVARVRRSVVGAVRGAVPPRVVGDHPGTSGQERDLELPHLGRARCTRSAAAGSPGPRGRPRSPYVCQATRTPSRSTYPVASGSRAFMRFSFRVVGTIRTGIAPVVSERGAGVDAPDEVVDGVVDDHRVAGLRQVTRSAEHQQLGAGQPRQVHAAGEGLALVVGAVDDQDGAARSPPASRRPTAGSSADELGGLEREHHLARRSAVAQSTTSS